MVGRLVSGRVAADFHSHLLPELGYIGVSGYTDSFLERVGVCYSGVDCLDNVSCSRLRWAASLTSDPARLPRRPASSIPEPFTFSVGNFSDARTALRAGIVS
jgi:hypothetical protein